LIPTFLHMGLWKSICFFIIKLLKAVNI
jgi:hypothetical protein